MRSGTCTVQQTLTAEAASILKHSLNLARRRGHAQVTPLHVAATLLSLRASLLRRACLKSQPPNHSSHHPLQCRALELCFNVALNRLPATPGPLLHAQPSLSNALIAALKRAQAHQRRGCIEQQQQQPLLTIKVELEQLIISILDDPSVSRVMREAGFSSTAVKNNIEDSSSASVFQCYTASAGVFSSPSTPETNRDNHLLHHHHHHHNININPSNTFWQTHFLTYSSDQNPFLFSSQNTARLLPATHNFTADSPSVKEDIKLVLQVLLRKKKKNTVIVADCVSITEAIIAELVGKLERGDVPDELKQTHFIKFEFAPVALKFMKKEDVEKKITELKRQVDSFTSSNGGGAILYTGDLKWTVSDETSTATTSTAGNYNNNGGSRGHIYNPMDHLVVEIGRLISEYNSVNSKVWFMATASYQTYTKCQMRQPPLEIQWNLQAVSVPSGGLGLSLHGSSGHEILERKPFGNNNEKEELACCADCTSNYHKEAQAFNSPPQNNLLPPWLQQHASTPNQKDDLVDLRKKWNIHCRSLHQSKQASSPLTSSQPSFVGKTYSYASSCPWWSTQSTIFPDSASISFVDSTLKPSCTSNSLAKFRRQNSCTIEFNFGNGGTHKNHQPAGEPSFDSFKNSEGTEVKITLALGHSQFSDSGKQVCERTRRLTELTRMLQENVPWQYETLPSIAETLVADSKSAMGETWMLIKGNDRIGKRRLARVIAESIFGSVELLLHISIRNRDDAEARPFCKMLTTAMKRYEKLVVLVEDADFADTQFVKLLADGFETRIFGDLDRRDSKSCQTVFILTVSDSSNNLEEKKKEKKNQSSVINMKLTIKERSPKRKTEWEFSNRAKKSPRIEEKNDIVLTRKIKKDFSRQSSFNSTLDLNMKADEEDEGADQEKLLQGEVSPISSDITRETSSSTHEYPRSIAINGFLDSIRNRFVFDRNQARDAEMKEDFMAKIKASFKKVIGTGNFSVEERVIEEASDGSGYFINSSFEKWLKDVFQTSLKTINNGGKEITSMEVKLGFRGAGEEEDDGFMGTCLPKQIQVCFED
ncbi:protein SMAX1-LIKE 4 [Carica papaya]|uniref:protein SMAX1-LIKE 4 n=1 Tax=Carica papaya TaxID=3649 RepID=UPI000B8CD0F9|nr:protein SMAX1-LIKE 4 [Carica papaya]